MLTDSEARALLHEAAETIEVAPAGPLQPQRHRTAVSILAAAAMVVAVAGGLALVTTGDDEPAPAEVPDASSSAPSPTIPTFATCGPNDLCEAGRMVLPSVLGLQEDEARERLDASGQDVVVGYEDHEGCQPDGMVLAQQPQAGATSPIGGTVRLTVNRNADDFCGGLPPPS